MSESKNINEIFNKVSEFIDDLIEQNKGYYKPEIAIYMSEDFWRECMNEIYGETNSCGYEFVSNRTIRGYPVFMVISRNIDVHGNEFSPPKYTICEIK